MTEFSLIVGGAGCGKTTALMEVLAKVIDQGYGAEDIGFFSFTRAARAEAAGRAAELLKCKASELEQDCWFRTLHSLCYRQLGCSKDQVLADDSKTRKWLKDEVGIESANIDMEEGAFRGGQSPEERALMIWHVSRNRLETLEECHSTVSGVSLTNARETIERYEQAKRLDGRMDFTDILGRFAGIEFGVDGHRQVAPHGDSPQIPVVFADEQQDASKLQNEVLKRVVANARWVYIAGDPFQSIYGWNGSDPRLMMAWPFPDSRRRILPKTWRCPAPIHELGERCLRSATDYWDRGIAPADHDGRLKGLTYSDRGWINEIDPRESWLLLARTNHLAARLSARLNANGIPWLPVKGNGWWNAPKRTAALNALYDLQQNQPIEAEEWKKIVGLLPAKQDGREILTRGTKTAWASRKSDLDDLANLDTLNEWGATPHLVGLIQDGRWPSLIPKSEQYVSARNRWGYDAVHHPMVQVGTIHSVKGAEADNVAILMTSSENVQQACNTQDGRNEEQRVAYVAVTRARRNLILLHEDDKRWRMNIA